MRSTEKKAIFAMMKSFIFSKSLRGKITVAGTLVAAVIISGSLYGFFKYDVHTVSADDVATSITVLNTPPTWNSGQEARESSASATTTPTNAGQTITWIATATDSSGDNYYLLICKTSATPTANASAPPECGGGSSNRWARSSATASNTQASAATTTIEFAPFNNESNNWFAWVCDGNASLPRCNSTFEIGATFGAQGSPFVVNHPPVFAAISNDSPENPGGTVTWTSTSYDTDVLETQDTVQLFVCRTASFNGSNCPGGGWATSTPATTNAATTTTLTIPMQDADYSAFVYIVDNHGLVATSTIQGNNSQFTVNNVAPSVTAATVALLDTDGSGNLTLLNAGASTSGFEVQFEVTDNNSCQNSSSGNEFSSAIANVYRSGVTQASCQISGDFNSNSCYPDASPFTDFSCTQDGGSCSGSSDTSATWTCTYSLWYNADPTFAANTQFPAQNWLASVQVTDDDASTSALTEGTTGNEMESFLAFNVSSTSIPYGSLEPGSNSGTLASSTDIIALGNVGMDEDLYGDTMCPTWSAPDSCDTNGFQAANDIVVGNQQFATSTVSYGGVGAYTLTSSSSPSTLLINVPKTTATTSPQTRYTFWGIAVPIAITTAGNYTGQNTLTAVTSNASFW